MSTEFQDKAWQVLPKEFKEEVKKEYYDCKHCNADACAIELETVFGKHNLASDAEGEDELLTVTRSKVQEQYALNSNALREGNLTDMQTEIAVKVKDTLYYLFGSKCLPDKTCNVASNVASKEPNPAEEEDVFNVPEPKCKHYKDGKCARPSVCHLENGKLVKGADCDVSSCEDVEYAPKPAEPKFKVGDYVRYKGDVHKVVATTRDNRCYLNKITDSISPSDLEPYTEPTANNPKESANTFASDEPTDTKSDDFDRIVNDGFRSHNRLHIAATILSGIYGNDFVVKHNYMKDLVKIALEATDALIAECELTDKLNK